MNICTYIIIYIYICTVYIHSRNTCVLNCITSYKYIILYPFPKRHGHSPWSLIWSPGALCWRRGTWGVPHPIKLSLWKWKSLWLINVIYLEYNLTYNQKRPVYLTTSCWILNDACCFGVLGIPFAAWRFHLVPCGFYQVLTLHGKKRGCIAARCLMLEPQVVGESERIWWIVKTSLGSKSRNPWLANAYVLLCFI